MFKKLFKSIKNVIKVTLRFKPEQTHFNEETQKPKHNYTSEAKALHSAKRLKFITGDAYGVYRCNDCGAWHIGPL